MGKGLGRDFLDFINRGNVVDLAVAVIIGAAFTKVVQTMVELFTTAALNPTMAELGIDSIDSWPAGKLMVALLNFVVVAVVMFVVVKSVERLRHRTAKADPAVDSQKQLTQAQRSIGAETSLGLCRSESYDS